MKRIGIGAIVVLLLIACAAEYIKSGERRKAIFDAIDAELREPAEQAVPRSAEQNVAAQATADLLSEVAAVGSLLDEEEADAFQKEREMLYRSYGAEFKMTHRRGFCEIEVRFPGAYKVHASGRDGIGNATIDWEIIRRPKSCHKP